jgi:hypothetical protein
MWWSHIGLFLLVKLFLDHLSSILHGALVGVGSLWPQTISSLQISSLQNVKRTCCHVALGQTSILGLYLDYILGLTASPTRISMWFQIVKFIIKKSKCASLPHEIGFFAPKPCRFPLLVKGATHCAPPKMSVINWTWLWISIYDWSRWFAISSCHIYAVPIIVSLVLLRTK